MRAPVDVGHKVDRDCTHANSTRVRRLFVHDRPLYQCDDCGVAFIYEDDAASSKALVPLDAKKGA